jgi:hypothetical protein
MNKRGHSLHLEPQYLSLLQEYPNRDPILISIDSPTQTYISRLNGMSLLCDHPAVNYELSFCFQKEIWVLYSRSGQFEKAMRLAQAIQLSGAKKIIVLHIKLRKVHHEQYKNNTLNHRIAASEHYRSVGGSHFI